MLKLNNAVLKNQWVKEEIESEMKKKNKILRKNENGHTIHQNL